MPGFNNNASFVGFIGSFNSVEDVIASDQRELDGIGGSFEEIADRIGAILTYAERAPKRGFELVNPEYDPKVRITFYALTKGTSTVRAKGSQRCPFEGCSRNWNEECQIINPITGRKLTINRGIEHLAREHHLLEKGNEYGISAKEFYEHFI